jgi:hypothetical protein
MKRALLIPYSFTLLNWAAIAALYYFARGRSNVWVRHEWTTLVREPNRLES